MHKSHQIASLPKWENAFCAAISEGLDAKAAFEWSSAQHANLIFTSEFELPGQIPVRFEARPSQSLWGAVVVTIVVSPRKEHNSDGRMGDVLPLVDMKGVHQGEATAKAFLIDGRCTPSSIAIYYVSQRLQRQWRHVCKL